MKNLMFMAAIAMVLTVFNACTKDELMNEISESQAPKDIQLNAKIENGILTFSTPVDFENAINQVIKSPTQPLTNSSQNFISLKESESKRLKSTSESSVIDTLVESDAFASLLNEKREIVVSDVLYKVTHHGTLFGEVSKLNRMRDIDTIKSISNIITPISTPSLKSAQLVAPTQTYSIEDGLYLYDTYGTYGGVPSTQIIPEPNYDGFLTFTENDRTLFGKGWDQIWGYSQSDYVRFDSDNSKCVDVKFYSQDFLVYSESGIKVKTQKQNWLGIWNKVDCDEIRVGWDYVEIEEEWPNFSQNEIQKMYNTVRSYSDPYTNRSVKYLGMSKTQFTTQTFVSIDIVGLNLAVTNKDLLNLFIKGGYNWAKNTFGSSVSSDVKAIREFNPYAPFKASTKIGKYELSEKNTDKKTFIFKNDFGVIVNLSILFGGGDGLSFKPGMPNPVSANFTLKRASVYGCARIGNEWKGIRYNYKYTD